MEGGSNRRKAMTVGAAGLLIGLAYALRLLVPDSWDPSVFVAFGELSTVETEYGQELLGEVVTRPQLGHDGRFFFAQANDPFYFQPEKHAVVLDRPIHRAQRMLYPTLAGLFGLLPPAGVVWGMLVVNLLALGAGSLLVGLIAAGRNRSLWLGLAFALNFALINEIDIGGAGVVAAAFAVAGVLAWERGRQGWAAVAISCAVLSREVMAMTWLGLIVLTALRRGRQSRILLTLPPITAVAWRVYVTWRLSSISPAAGIGESLESFSLPFVGLARAVRTWLEDPLDLALNAVVLVVLVVFAIRAVRSRDALAWGSVGFVALAPFLSYPIWAEPYDISRAVAPVFTAYAVLLLAPAGGSVREAGKALPRVGEAIQRP